ncbi:MAG: hypothetical protein AB8F95_10285 [Bacteroidia bacterium]
MLNRLLILLVLLAGISVTTFAQKNKTEDVIYLKNGSVLRGIVIERVPGSHVKILITTNSELTVKEEEIARLEQQKPANMQIYYLLRSNRRKVSLERSGRQKGLAFQWGINLSGSTDAWGDFSVIPGVTMKAMYHLPSQWSLGAGIGVTPLSNGGIIPMFVEAQKTFGKSVGGQPYVFGQLGYGHGAWDSWGVRDFKGGPMTQIGAGYTIHTRRRTEWMFAFGIQVQPTSFDRVDWNWGWEPEPVVIGNQNSLQVVPQLTIGMGL